MSTHKCVPLYMTKNCSVEDPVADRGRHARRDTDRVRHGRKTIAVDAEASWLIGEKDFQ